MSSSVMLQGRRQDRADHGVVCPKTGEASRTIRQIKETAAHSACHCDHHVQMIVALAENADYKKKKKKGLFLGLRNQTHLVASV